MKEKLTSYQFLAIMFLVPYGTANLFFLETKNKNNVWITLLLYAILSIIVQMIYISLFNKYPKDSIVTYLPKIYGKYLGFILSIIYVWYFAYLSARNLRDFVELTTSFSLIRMPIYITTLIFILVITYGVYKGIENIGSMAQIGFIIITSSVFIIFILLNISKNVLKFDEFLPILHIDFIQLITSSWRMSMFPYGEFIAMAMLYPFFMQKNKLKKTIIFTSILEGIFLALDNILFITALGYQFAISNDYPLLETLRLVRIGDFLNRLDIIFIIVLMLGGFFKISVLMYISALGISQIFKPKNWGLLCFTLGILIFITSLIIARDNSEHLNIGRNVVSAYIHPSMVLIIPLLSLIIYYLKKLIEL